VPLSKNTSRASPSPDRCSSRLPIRSAWRRREKSKRQMPGWWRPRTPFHKVPRWGRRRRGSFSTRQSRRRSLAWSSCATSARLAVITAAWNVSTVTSDGRQYYFLREYCEGSSPVLYPMCHIDWFTFDPSNHAGYEWLSCDLCILMK